MPRWSETFVARERRRLGPGVLVRVAEARRARCQACAAHFPLVTLLRAGLESRRFAFGVGLRFLSRARAPCACLPAAILLQLVDELQAPGERGTQCEQQARGAASELEQRTTTTAGGQMKEADGLSCLISMLDAERVRDSEQKSVKRQEQEKEWVKAMEMEEEKERIRNSFPSSSASSGPCSCAPCFLNKINAKNIQTLPCKSKR